MVKTLYKLLFLIILFACNQALAELSASVDRTQITESDIISLTLRSTDGPLDADLDVSVLEPDFTILNSRRSNQVSIINGRREAYFDLVLVLAPNRTGRLTIPAFTSKGESSQAIDIEVGKGPADSAQELSDVFLEAEVSTPEAYVQEQILYTVRLYYSISLDEANLTNLEVENALVTMLGEQTKYETVRGGIRYSVVERRYSIFPQSSGRLHVPALILSGRGNNQFFSFGRSSPSKPIYMKTPEFYVEVLPKPDVYPKDAPWLPSWKVELQDSWSNDTPTLRVGESATRRIDLLGHGLTAAQLPELSITGGDGFKVYPDQQKVNDQVTADGVLGQRSLSAAIVPTQAGQLHFPAIGISWWNSQRNRLEHSVIPGKTLEVLPASGSLAETSSIAQPATDLMAPAPGADLESQLARWIWPGLSAVFAALWLFTILLWWKSGTGSRPGEPKAGNTQQASVRQTFNRLKEACRSNDPQAARSALIQWFDRSLEQQHIQNLDDIAALNLNPDLTPLLRDLEQSIYGKDRLATWNGDALLEAVKKLSLHQDKAAGAQDRIGSLYPL